jgi:putative phosphoribosyl transferase
MSRPESKEVMLGCGEYQLAGTLSIPNAPMGVVVFAHGSGSGRFSPRNQYVAGILQQANLATLLMDLLEVEEAEDREKVFDIELLASRLQGAADWLAGDEQTRDLPLGYFGASTGAGAALVAAARKPVKVAAVVSRGGRPDLANGYLERVTAPTLLIVGGDDGTTLRLNEDALAQLSCRKELVVIPGATHLFSEPGALEKAARLAKEWFVRYLAPAA